MKPRARGEITFSGVGILSRASESLEKGPAASALTLPNPSAPGIVGCSLSGEGSKLRFSGVYDSEWEPTI
jgi:hypothetical protein